MKAPGVLLIAVVLAGCVSMASQSESRFDASRCFVEAQRRVAFSSAVAKDIIEVTASGADCTNAIVTVSIRLADGVPVAAFAQPLIWLHPEIDPKTKLSREALSALVHAYIDEAHVDAGGSTIPIWKRREPTPGFEQGLELTSPLFRRDYEALRKAKPNLLCLGDAFETGVCYVWDAKLARAVAILHR